MRRWRVAAAFAAAAALTAAGAAATGLETGAAPPAAPPAAGEEKVLKGIITYREADGTFIIRTDTGKFQLFHLTAKSPVTRNGRPSDWSKLRKGDRITARPTKGGYELDVVATGPE